MSHTDQDEIEDSSAPLIEHLAELRTRLIRSVIAFIIGAAVSFIFLMSGVDFVLGAFRGWAPEFVVEQIASLSFLTHFTAITQGLIDVRDIAYFVALIVASLFINVLIVDVKKAV